MFIPSIARIGRMVIEKEATVSLQLLRVAGCIGCQASQLCNNDAFGWQTFGISEAVDALNFIKYIIIL